MYKSLLIADLSANGRFVGLFSVISVENLRGDTQPFVQISDRAQGEGTFVVEHFISTV